MTDIARVCPLLILGAALVLGAACAPIPAHYHPKKPLEFYKPDYEHCVKNARMLHDGKNAGAQADTFESEIGLCMEAKGYVWNHDQPPSRPTAGPGDKAPNGFAVLEGLYHDKDLAAKRLAYLSGVGMPAVEVGTIDFGPRGLWYKVMIGQFPTHAEAESALAEIVEVWNLKFASITAR